MFPLAKSPPRRLLVRLLATNLLPDPANPGGTPPVTGPLLTRGNASGLHAIIRRVMFDDNDRDDWLWVPLPQGANGSDFLGSINYAPVGLEGREIYNNKRHAARTLAASDYRTLVPRNGVFLARETIADKHNVIGWMNFGLFMASQTEHLVGFPGLRVQDASDSRNPGRNFLAETFGHIYHAYDRAASNASSNNIIVLVGNNPNTSLVGAVWRGAAFAKNSALQAFIGGARVSIIDDTIEDPVWDHVAKFEVTNLTGAGGSGTLPDIVYEHPQADVGGAFSLGGAHAVPERYRQAFSYDGNRAAIEVRGSFLGSDHREIVGNFVVYEEEADGTWKYFDPGAFFGGGDFPNPIVRGVFGVKRDGTLSAGGGDGGTPSGGSPGGTPGGGAVPSPIVTPPPVAQIPSPTLPMPPVVPPVGGTPGGSAVPQPVVPPVPQQPFPSLPTPIVPPVGFPSP